MSESVRAALAAVVDGRTLSRREAEAAMGAVMEGEATPAQLAALLVALRMRGETVEELTGFAAAMRSHALPVEAPAGVVDTCGTGGDGSGTFNISTAAALVVAAAGVPVAKHGNRAVTSASGSSDVLDALGVQVEETAAEAESSLRDDRFAFLFAPAFHPAMRHAGPTRRELGIRTAFNLIGPLTNPAGAKRQVVGVGAPAAAEKLAAALWALGTERAFVVHGEGIDELPLDGSGVCYDVSPAGIERRTVPPEDAGLAAADTGLLRGGSPAENAAIILEILRGATGPRRDVVVLNAAAVLQVSGRVPDLRAGAAVAAGVIDDGAAMALLERLRERRARNERASAAAPAPLPHGVPQLSGTQPAGASTTPDGVPRGASTTSGGVPLGGSELSR